MSAPSGPTIQNGNTVPINVQTGTIPDVSGALFDYFQYITFIQVTKTAIGFEVSETQRTNTSFWGVMIPMTKNLNILPEGQRAWRIWDCYSQVALPLQVDDVVEWQGSQFRVLARDNYLLYGYYHYTLTQDWTGSGPT